jgi:DNA-directed RNA polymerase specialized sigma24 family protein
MGRKAVILKAVLALALVWAIVFGVRTWAGSKRITAERVEQQIAEANFADWSTDDAPQNAAEAKRRDKELREIAALTNRLDFYEREKNRENRTGEQFFRKLNPAEKQLFVDLTVVESMNRFMEALDGLPPEQRKKFVEQGLQEIEAGRTAEEMARTEELGEDLLDRISQEGMRAYFEKSSAETKLDLAPLMESMNEVMQGLRGNEFGIKR